MLGLRRAALSATRLRCLSTAALPEVAPITMFGTAGRYANAMYAAAAKNKALEDVQADLTLLKGTLAASPALHNFCTDPSQSRDAKAKGITEVLTAAKANDTTKKSLATLAEGGRLGDVMKVIDMYDELITAAKGEVKAVITSAEPLAAEDLAQITKQLNDFLEPGQTSISLQTKVDTGLVSGITVEIGDKYLDFSVATQLKKLQMLLKDGL